jgi:hypothetical protein
VHPSATDNLPRFEQKNFRTGTRCRDGGRNSTHASSGDDDVVMLLFHDFKVGVWMGN